MGNPGTALLAVTCLAGAAVLSGCTSKVDGLVALHRVGGHVHAFVQMCDGHTVDTVTLKESGGTFDDAWTFDEPVSDSDQIDIGVFDDAVALLDNGSTYELKASSSTEGDQISGPKFVSDDLAALADGEYLTPAGPFNQDGFDRMVGSYCG